MSSRVVERGPRAPLGPDMHGPDRRFLTPQGESSESPSGPRVRGRHGSGASAGRYSAAGAKPFGRAAKPATMPTPGRPIR